MKTVQMPRQPSKSEIFKDLSLTDRLGMAASGPNGIKKMRELILELAVRGKLVPKDPKDEPASELLKRIKAEKEKLINAGKVKKGDQLPEITNADKPFGLPKGWEWTRLQDISKNIHYGYTASANPTSKDILFLRITDIQDNRVDWESVPGCNIGNNKFPSYALSNGDILIARTGGTIGKSYLVENITKKVVFASYLIRVERLNSTYPDYTKVYLGSKLYWDQLFSKSMGTGQPNVNGTALKSLIFPLPPLGEQKSIVAKVDELMFLCDRLEAREADAASAHETLVRTLLETLTKSQIAEEFQENWQRIAKNFNILFTTESSLDALKQTILQLAVKGKLVPQDPNNEPASELLTRIRAEKEKLIKAGKIKKEKPLPEITDVEKTFDLPKGWEWAYIGQISHDWGQKTPDKKFAYIDVSAIDNSMGVIKELSIIEAREAPSRARKIVQQGTVIYSTVRPYLLNIAVIDRDLSPEPIASTAFAVIHPLGNISSKYLFWCLRSPFFIKHVEAVQTGIAYPAINDGQFFNSIIPIPPFAEQQLIVAKIDELMTLCDSLKEPIVKFRSLHEQLATALVEKAVAA